MGVTLAALNRRMNAMEQSLLGIPKIIMDEFRKDQDAAQPGDAESTGDEAETASVVPTVDDPWRDQRTFVCGTCRHFRAKTRPKGRCRRQAPTLQGYPVVFEFELGCGEHKLA